MFVKIVHASTYSMKTADITESHSQIHHERSYSLLFWPIAVLWAGAEVSLDTKYMV